MRGLVLGLALLLAPSIVRADSGSSQEPKRAAQRRAGRDLIIAGSVLLGASYSASLTTSAVIGGFCPIEANALCTDSKWAWGFAPIAGPWVQLGYDHESPSADALYLVPGVVQAIGLAVLAAGAAIYRKAGPRRPVVRAVALPGVVGLSLAARF